MEYRAQDRRFFFFEKFEFLSFPRKKSLGSFLIQYTRNILSHVVLQMKAEEQQKKSIGTIF